MSVVEALSQDLHRLRFTVRNIPVSVTIPDPVHWSTPVTGDDLRRPETPQRHPCVSWTVPARRGESTAPGGSVVVDDDDDHRRGLLPRPQETSRLTDSLRSGLIFANLR